MEQENGTQLVFERVMTIEPPREFLQMEDIEGASPAPSPALIDFNADDVDSVPPRPAAVIPLHAAVRQQDPVTRVFNFGTAAIRTVMVDGEPMWVAKDVAEALGYTWNGSAAIKHIPEEWRGVRSVLTPHGSQEMAVLSEQGLHFFLGRSDKAAAIPFQKWIAGEVIPSIRKTGSYQLQPQHPQVPLTLPDALRAYAQAIDDKAVVVAENKFLSCRVQVLEPKGDFHDAVTEAEDGQSVRAVAHQISNGLGKKGNVGQNELFRWLRHVGYLIPGAGGRTPYQQFIREGLFNVIPQTWVGDPNGSTSPKVHIASKTLITGLGFIRFQKEFKLADVPSIGEDNAQAVPYRRDQF